MTQEKFLGKKFWKRWNALDIFLILFVLLLGAAFYFGFVNPVQFSHLIRREGVKRVAEVEVFLYDDLTWIRGFIPEGDEYRNVYGELEWKVLGMEEVTLEGKKWMKVRVRVPIVEENSGILRYGKYTLSQGNSIHFISDQHVFGGRIFKYRVLDEKIPE